MRVDQLIPAYHRGDAIGDTATHMKQYFLSQGFESQIYCLTRDDDLENESELFDNFKAPSAGDVSFFHFALPSPLTPAFIKLKSKKVILYHNITPEKYFTDYSREMARLCRLGRDELKSLTPYVDLALADSEFNRRELLEFGFKKTAVFPLFVDYKKYEKAFSQFMFDLFDDERTNILFIGRIVPNKAIEDLIKTAFYYKKYISPLVRLIITGKTSSLPKYYEGLIRMADEFYFTPEEICFTGHISDEEMYALYRVSDVFLSLSEHEGFGLPFIECMMFDLPVIAYNCTAVPDTLGDSGILINHKRVDYVGELVHLVARDKKVKAAVIEGQKKQLKKYREQDLKALLLNHFNILIGENG